MFVNWWKFSVKDKYVSLTCSNASFLTFVIAMLVSNFRLFHYNLHEGNEAIPQLWAFVILLPQTLKYFKQKRFKSYILKMHRCWDIGVQRSLKLGGKCIILINIKFIRNLWKSDEIGSYLFIQICWWHRLGFNTFLCLLHILGPLY